MLKETDYNQLEIEILNDATTVVLAYTTMCGTCESAKRMLEIVSAILPDTQYLKVNINLNSQLIKTYDITSIPCFLIFNRGILIDQFYAFHSVTYLFEKINQIH